MTLKYFSNREVLSHVDRSLLTRLFDDYKEHLPPDAAALTRAQLEFEPFCQVWAGQFSSPNRFGAPLRDALLAIDNLARPENESLLKEALAHLPPGYVVNQNFSSLHQALHLWIIAQNTPGVSFPSLPGSQASACSNSERQPDSVNSQSSTVESVAIVNCKSPIELSASAAPQSSIAESNAPIAAGDNGRAPALENQNSKIKNSIGPSSTFAQDLTRLALLSAVEYELVRRAEAKRLNLRVSILDDAVERARILEDDAQANALKLPQLEPWPEPITDAPALFDQVHDRCLLYLYLPSGAAVVITLWPGHAHAINAFTLSPRLNFTSTEPGCGKTTALDFLATLCPNVLRTDNLKTAVLFRVVEQQQPTLLLDELDSYLHLYPDLRGLLNSGHSDSGYAHRCEGKIVRAFRSFAATALAGIGGLANTLRDRSIQIHLPKAPPGVLKARFDKRRVETETMLGRKIARWVQDNFAAIADCDPVLPPAAHNRLGDNWRPLFALAQLIGGHWPQRINDAFAELTAKKQPAAVDATTLALLSDIRTVFNQTGVPRISSIELLACLRAMPAGPGYDPSSIDSHWLAGRLRPFDIRPRTIRIGDARVKGYMQSDFAPLFSKFLTR